MSFPRKKDKVKPRGRAFQGSVSALTALNGRCCKATTTFSANRETERQNTRVKTEVESLNFKISHRGILAKVTLRSGQKSEPRVSRVQQHMPRKPRGKPKTIHCRGCGETAICIALKDTIVSRFFYSQELSPSILLSNLRLRQLPEVSLFFIGFIGNE